MTDFFMWTIFQKLSRLNTTLLVVWASTFNVFTTEKRVKLMVGILKRTGHVTFFQTFTTAFGFNLEMWTTMHDAQLRGTECLCRQFKNTLKWGYHQFWGSTSSYTSSKTLRHIEARKFSIGPSAHSRTGHSLTDVPVVKQPQACSLIKQCKTLTRGRFLKIF